MKIIKSILSIIYWVIISFVLFLYKNKILPAKNINTHLISVGNITVGGTGKSPMVIYLSKLLEKLNISHSVVSRGYGRKSKNMIVVNDGVETCAKINDSGDEAQVLSQKLKNVPIVVLDHYFTKDEDDGLPPDRYQGSKEVFDAVLTKKVEEQKTRI